MAGHIELNGDSTFAAISILSVILASIGLGGVAAIVGIVSGLISLFINYPKLKERIKQITKKVK